MTPLRLALTLSVMVVAVSHVHTMDVSPGDDLQKELDSLKAQVAGLSESLSLLARQAMGYQYALEERSRTDGDSGIKLVRGSSKGPQNYYGSTHISGACASIHDHNDHDRTLGMGEVSAVLNGVEFRTRHNDYKLVMPSTTSKVYHALENIPFPEVPPEVLALENPEDQEKEMREWFRAFAQQDSSVRDYRPYFKPVLCYMEGAWTRDDRISWGTELNGTLAEPFPSDRHSIDADSYQALTERIRYVSYTGTKNRLENFAYLPSGIMSMNQETGKPNYAQWTYRILCHPTEQDIPLKYLKQVDDLSNRYPKRRSMKQVRPRRAARFRLYEEEQPMFTTYSLLDKLFYKVPGIDNVPDELRETTFGESIFKFDQEKELNTGYYHRWFRFAKNGAMGLATAPRGFNDENLWVAETTQTLVAPMSVKMCKTVKRCETISKRFSYAIPLEIIYMTPLLKWDPYGIVFHKEAGIATKDGRTGSSEAKAMNGVDSKNYYRTPATFFSSKKGQGSAADTSKGMAYVKDSKGEVRQTVASGTPITMPEIEGAGEIRLRYPIMPIHGEGSSVWKELNALRDYVLSNELSNKNDDNDDDDDDDDNESKSLDDILEFRTSYTIKPSDHMHTFTMTRKQYLDLQEIEGHGVNVSTSLAAGHDHKMTIRYMKRLQYSLCDEKSRCWDGHPRKIFPVDKVD